MAKPTDSAWQILDAAEQLCSAVVISAAVKRLAQEITVRLRDDFPLVLGIMRGSVMFAGQLLPQLRFPLEFDYIDVTRYGDSTLGGSVVWKVRPGNAVSGRTVLVLDDILDEGKTLMAIHDSLLADGASCVYSAVFAEKATGRTKPISADFVGVRLPNRYVFGFGMDVRGLWRNLPEIYALMESAEHGQNAGE